MKRKAYRSFLPFDNRGPDGFASISPTTNKSVIPTNNVPTIQDILSGEVKIGDVYPDANGSWGKGKDIDSSYREEGDDYKRKSRDLDIIEKMLFNKDKMIEKWQVKVDGGRVVFDSFSAARRYMREKNIPVRQLSKIAQNNTSLIIADSINKCLMVESINYMDGVRETGSCFCVGKNLFITCAHVVKKYNKYKQENINKFHNIPINLIQNGSKYKAKLVKVDLTLDLALLQSEVDVDPFEIDNSFKLGDQIISISSPHGYENHISYGILGSLNRKIYKYNNAPDYMFIDLDVFPGSSGGPIIKIENGKVIGIITLIIATSGEYGLNAALSSSYLQTFLK